MDVAGISAIAAASAAAIGVPAALLVGRWQLKGALAQAEQTGIAGVAAAQEAARAGIAQAESSYRAALDAVQAQANSTREQWVRGVQRDAYAAFLVATSQVRDASDRMQHEYGISEGATPNHAQNRADLRQAMISLRNAKAVVYLESDPFMRDLSYQFSLITELVSGCLESKVEMQEAEYALGRLCEPNPSDSTLRETAETFRDSLRELYQEVVTRSPDGDPRQGSAGLASEILTALDRVHASRNQLPESFPYHKVS